MPRSARIIHPGAPHHVTQRGNRRQQVFFAEDDYAHYLVLLSESCRSENVQCWAYCLMPNHVHLVLVPEDGQSLSRAVGRTHRLYTQYYNRGAGGAGLLWQGRFKSSFMDEARLFAACRYIEFNPVRAGLVARTEDWRWSSVHAHLAGKDDGVVRVAPMQDRVADWDEYLHAVDPDA
ncbi:transposase [Maricaulis maris]|jgi:REP-associated tyrosine transposase|uniref:transposase n=1 Tax=Maricaulis maris TaxID=74318 RepID=UPI00291FA5E5|nr:transposase [Maricaulis maris]